LTKKRLVLEHKIRSRFERTIKRGYREIESKSTSKEIKSKRKDWKYQRY